jgi:hypothetical protein
LTFRFLWITGNDAGVDALFGVFEFYFLVRKDRALEELHLDFVGILFGGEK